MATLEQQLLKLIEQFIPEIRNAFLAAIRDVTERAILKDMITAIEHGDPIGAFRAVGFSDAAMRPVTALIEEAFETGGVTVAGTFPRRLNTPTGRTVFRFDVRNSRAEQWLRTESSTLVTRISSDVQTVIRNTMTEGMQAGRNPRDVALDLIGRVNTTTGRREGGVIGLTTQYERAVARARTELRNLDPAYFNRTRRDKRFDAIVRRAIKDGRPLPSDVINKLAGRYSDRLLQLRGENIARTEAIASLNRSEYEAIKQAVDQGAINQPATKRVWDTAGDTRVRHTHRIMDGQEVGLDEPFTAPDGSKLMYPGDTTLGAPGSETINCRCRVRLKVDWLGDLD